MKKVATAPIKRNKDMPTATGRCLCGDVEIEIDFPAFWAWHDHSAASRRAHGAAYATYAGVWRKRFRVTKGEKHITRHNPGSVSATSSPLSSTSRRSRTTFGFNAAKSFSNTNVPV